MNAWSEAGQTPGIGSSAGQAGQPERRPGQGVLQSANACQASTHYDAVFSNDGQLDIIRTPATIGTVIHADSTEVDALQAL